MNFMYMLRYTRIRWCGISTLELPYPTLWKRKIHRLKIAGFQGRGIWFTFTFYYCYWEPFPKIHHVSRLANLALPGCQVGTSLDMSPKIRGNCTEKVEILRFCGNFRQGCLKPHVFWRFLHFFFAKTNICPIDDIQSYLLVFLGKIFLGSKVQVIPSKSGIFSCHFGSFQQTTHIKCGPFITTPPRSPQK